MRRRGYTRACSPGSYELRYSLGIDPAIGKRRSASRLYVVAVRTL
jgi:hypothetical protein